MRYDFKKTVFFLSKKLFVFEEKNYLFCLTGGLEGVTGGHLQDLGMTYEEKIKSENFSKNFLFSMKKNRLNFLESHVLMTILYDL